MKASTSTILAALKGGSLTTLNAILGLTSRIAELRIRRSSMTVTSPHLPSNYQALKEACIARRDLEGQAGNSSLTEIAADRLLVLFTAYATAHLPIYIEDGKGNVFPVLAGERYTATYCGRIKVKTFEGAGLNPTHTRIAYGLMTGRVHKEVEGVKVLLLSVQEGCFARAKVSVETLRD
jgi:hypothetical protein